METRKTAVVTGANRGIGYETARQLAKRGWHVFAACRTPEKAKQAARSLQAERLTVEPLVMDVSNPDSIKAAAQDLSLHVDCVHALVNNAGIYLDQQSRGIDADPDVVITTFQTNALGPLLVARALLPLMEKAGGAQVINVSSGMGQLTDMNGHAAGYRMSKVALNAVTRMLAEELAPAKISVNSICPGWVRTDMGSDRAPRTPEQGADTIVWLAAGEAGATGSFFRDRKVIPW